MCVEVDRLCAGHVCLLNTYILFEYAIIIAVHFKSWIYTVWVAHSNRAPWRIMRLYQPHCQGNVETGRHLTIRNMRAVHGLYHNGVFCVDKVPFRKTMICKGETMRDTKRIFRKPSLYSKSNENAIPTTKSIIKKPIEPNKNMYMLMCEGSEN